MQLIPSTRAILFSLFAVVAILVGANPSNAAFPERTVTLVVAYPPGGATDVIARLLAKQLSSQWGQQVVVENKPGASGMVGGDFVARAKPDGYTLLLGYAPEVAYNKLTSKSMPYDPVRDLTPLTLMVSAPLVLASGPKRPVKTVKEIADLKGTKDLISYGSPGYAGQQHVAGALLAHELAIPMTQIQYKGTGPAVTDLLGGQIDLFFATIPPLLPHIRAGKLQPVAVAGDKRDPLLPDVPTFVELGYPRVQVLNWFVLVGPGNMPPELARQIAGDAAKALAEPSVTRSLVEQGLVPKPLQGAELAAFIGGEMRNYQTLLDLTRITPQ